MIDTLPKVKKRYLNHLNRINDYKLIQELHNIKGYDVSIMCDELGIKRSSYYKWTHSKPTQLQLIDEIVLAKIKEVAESNNSLFGAIKMTYFLKNEYGFTVGHNKVARLMSINDIKSSFRNKGKYTFIKSTPETTAENILSRDFNASTPFEKWLTDVTEVKAPASGVKLYMAPMLDLYGLYPIAVNVSDRNDTNLTDSLLNEAHNLYPEAKPLAHSDRGFQYTRSVYKSLLEEYGMTQSMSRVSRCIDNGPCENFQGIFKSILYVLYPEVKTKDELLIAIEGTLDYYINKYPQTRFKGRTSGQVFNGALLSANPVNYPIKKSNRYIKYWNHIEELKLSSITQSIQQ